MWNKQRCLRKAVLAAALIGLATQARGDDVIMDDGTTRVSLRVQLEKGLRAMRPVEFRFLHEVLAQVKKGDLPKDLVEQAFLWARQYPAYRVQYFEKALRSLTKRAGIDFTTKVSSFDPGFNTPGVSRTTTRRAAKSRFAIKLPFLGRK
jgi:hypothetical protein